MGLYNFSTLEVKGLRSSLELFKAYNLKEERGETYLIPNFVMPLTSLTSEEKYKTWGSEEPIGAVSVKNNSETELVLAFVTKNTVLDKWLYAASLKYPELAFKLSVLTEDEATDEHLEFTVTSTVNGVLTVEAIALDRRIAIIDLMIEQVQDESNLIIKNLLTLADSNEYTYVDAVLTLIYDEDQEFYDLELLEEFREQLVTIAD